MLPFVIFCCVLCDSFSYDSSLIFARIIIHPDVMDFYVGFCSFTGQIALFLATRAEETLANHCTSCYSCMFCTVIQSCVNDCFFLEKCPAKIAAKTLRCCLAACSLYQGSSAGPHVPKNNGKTLQIHPFIA